MKRLQKRLKEQWQRSKQSLKKKICWPIDQNKNVRPSHAISKRSKKEQRNQKNDGQNRQNCTYLAQICIPIQEQKRNQKR